MMTNGRELDGREVYQIKVQGGLPENWSDWFNGMTITVENESDGPPVTTLTGTVDQSALHGILAKIRDLTEIGLVYSGRVGGTRFESTARR